MPDSNKAINLWLVSGIAVAGIAYRLVLGMRLEQTALLFIGIPSILAILVAATPRAKSVTGAIMKAITIALLLSGPFLGEGFICIIMAAPLFYLVGAIVGP
ncbi:MAG TPA: hypothetical protein VHA33_30860 [Candidatus Angelobacter sp.]|jgi:hypothetical protein|nr:hypothetical protein [Candidatus Angelobacter sp.]